MGLNVIAGFVIIYLIMGIVSPEDRIDPIKEKIGKSEIMQAIKKGASKEYIDYLKGIYKQ